MLLKKAVSVFNKKQQDYDSIVDIIEICIINCR